MQKEKSLIQHLDIEAWLKLQKSISDATKMAILIVDYKGIPLTQHSGCSKFCEHVRLDSEFNKYCQKCDARGSLEAVIAQRPFVYRCHFSIVDIAIPIIVNGNYIGAIMAGQIHLLDDGSELSIDQILTLEGNKIALKKQELQENYDELPRVTYKELNTMITMIEQICSYLAKEIQQKEQVESLIPTLNSGSTKFDLTRISNRIVAKALEYVLQMKGQMVTLNEVAHFCSVSPQHLSRLFSKEIGETYTSYVSKLKITCAKEILETTDMRITEISDQLGFSEPGYFIKTFKKYTNETPLNYRMSHKYI